MLMCAGVIINTVIGHLLGRRQDGKQILHAHSFGYNHKQFKLMQSTCHISCKEMRQCLLCSPSLFESGLKDDLAHLNW